MYQQQILPQEVVSQGSVSGGWGRRFLSVFTARIGVKLALAFALVVGFNGLSTLVSLQTVNELQEQTGHVSKEALPALLTGMSVKADVAALNQLNMVLTAANSTATLDELEPQVFQILSAMEQELASLAARTRSQKSAHLSAQLGQYRLELENVIRLKRTHLMRERSYAELEAGLAAAYGALSQVVQPIGINTLFDLQTSLRTLAQSSDVEQTGIRLADREVNAISYASTLIASANLVVANVKELARLQEKSAIFKLRRQNSRDLGRLTSAARGFVGQDAAEKLRPVVAEFAAYFVRKSDRNLFDQRAKLAEQEQTLIQTSAKSVALLATISGEIDDLAAALGSRTLSGIEKSSQQARQAVNLLLLLAVGIVVASVVILAVMVRRNIVQRLKTLAGYMQQLARGETDFRVSVSGVDEIARMARQVEFFRLTAVEKERLARAAAETEEKARKAEEDRREQDRQREETRRRQLREQEQKAREERRAALNELASTLEENTKRVLGDVIEAAEGMRHTATVVAGSSRDTREQNMSVVAAAVQSHSNMQAVAAATEELVASLQSVRDYVRTSHEASLQAQSSAAQSHETVGSLAHAVSAVDESVSQIEEIASQTHLLALNAGIEASRAGAAGRGFAVVAQEVKKLATQTATVTGGITDSIKLIRQETGHAQASSSEILELIEGMSQTVTQIFETIDAQTETVTEIARNVHDAANDAGHIEQGVETVNRAIENSESEIQVTRQKSEELMDKAHKLERQVASFLEEVRADA